MYRENKYGEKVDVNKYECGSCKYYLFEREDETNKCTHYGKYYDCNDRCNYWEEANEVSGGGCFLPQQPAVSIKGFLITVMNWRHYADLEMKYYLRKKKVYS
ncbi:MAG: hypothetical protein ACLVGL_15385 [Waltera sp.]